jgi:hypothetical protein
MSQTTQAVAFLPSSCFGGILHDRSYIALTLILTEQFLSVFAPVITRFFHFIKVLIYSGDDNDSNSATGDRSYEETRTASDGSREKGAPIVSKTYERFIDDKKPTIGTKSDIKRLEDFGYDKYRFLSASFMKRNKLDRKKE